MVETERNMRGEHLVVQSLEVLEDFTGGAAHAIDAKIGSVQETVVNVASRADKFYQDAAADGIITPEEKKTLKRDFGELRRVYLAILQQAEIKGLSDDPRITGLTTVYSALYTYLYSTIKVFDDMQTNTVITSSDDMNEYYDTYFDAEMFAQAVLTQTALAYVRVLSSLDDPGLSNELGYYKGQLYRYVVNEGWQAVSSGDYMGVVSSASALAEKGDVPDGSFFLCGSSFIVAEYRLTTSGGVMTTDGGNHFALTVRADAGDVWALEGGVWRRVPDRNDWRYILATNDLVAIGEPISPLLEGHVRDIAESAAQEVAGGAYLGPRTADPVSPSSGDFFLYVGNTTAARKNGFLYRWTRTGAGAYAWTELSSEDPANYRCYMDALSDMLREDSQSLDTGRFSVVFARSLAVMSAMIETLMAQTLILKSGGVFKSEIFNEHTGFQLNADGRFECVNGKFNGNIDSGPLYLEKTSPGIVSVSASAGSNIASLWSTLEQNGLTERTLSANVQYGSTTLSSVLFHSEQNTATSSYTQRSTINSEGSQYWIRERTWRITTITKTYTMNSTQLGQDVSVTAEIISTNNYWSSTEYNEPAPSTGTTYGTLSAAFSLTANTDAWTMLLRNIPSGSSPSYPAGTIYRIGNGLYIA